MKQTEVQFLKDWSMVILNHLKEEQPNSEMLLSMGEIIENAFIKEDVKGMRFIKQDLSEWSKGLNKAKQEQINDDLKSLFGSSVQIEVYKLINKVLSKGKIQNDLDWQVINQFVSDTDDNGKNQSLVEILNKYLLNYESKK